MTTTAFENSHPDIDDRLSRHDLVFPGALVALLFGLLERILAEPLIASRIAQAPEAGQRTIRAMLWVSSILSPLAFAISVALSAMILWALGQFVEERTSFRALLNISAIAQVTRLSVVLILLAATRLGVFDFRQLGTATILGTAFRPGDGLLESFIRSSMNPAAWISTLVICLILRKGLRWTMPGALVSSLSLFALQVLVSALRIQQSFLGN